MRADEGPVICKLDIKESTGEPSAYNSEAPPYESYPAALYRHGRDVPESAPSKTRFVHGMSSDPPVSTDAMCQWCLHTFDTPPVGMPSGLVRDGKFVVSGVYCSMECAAAHNFDRHHASHSAYVRHSMLCELASSAARTVDPVHIRPAPPREMLRAFGGPFTVDEFRDRERAYTVIYPLHVVCQPKCSEDVAFQGRESSSARPARFVPIDDEAIDAFTMGGKRPSGSKRGFKSTLEYMRSNSNPEDAHSEKEHLTAAVAVKDEQHLTR